MVKMYLEVDSVAVSLRSSEVLGIVTGLHVVPRDLHVDLVPGLNT